MKRSLFSVLCVAAALALFIPDSLAQAPAAGGATGGAGARRRGGGAEDRARQIIAKYDKDGDHALNATELAAFFEAIHQRVEERVTEKSSGSSSSTPSPSGRLGKHAGGTPQERAAKAIEKFDKNGDGKLDAGELVALLHVVRERVSQGHSGGQAPRRPAPATPAPTGTTSA